MKSLGQYSIPLKGMNFGVHSYRFALEKEFFISFNESPIEDANLVLNVDVDKRPNLVVIDMMFEGTFKSPCDRCLQEINLPLNGEHQYLIKYAEEEKELDEVIYVGEEKAQLDLSKYIYELVILSLPISKVYDCEDDENAPCDQDVLDMLEASESENEENPIWEELKKMNKN